MQDLPKMILALVIGALGGAGFWYLGLPLPWMLGALFTTMFAAIAGLPLHAPGRLRVVVIPVIGVMLGARFTPDVIQKAGDWLLSLGLLAAYLLVVGIVIVPFYHYIGRKDWKTAFFAGMPGGLAEMIEFGENRGADVRSIVLAHSLRIAVTIALIALWFRVVQGHDVGSGGFSDPLPLELEEALLLIGAAVAGTFLGKWLRLPAHAFLGPMAVSAGLHLAGISESAPPALLVNLAQVILGTILGARFRGVPLGALRPAALLALGSTVLTLAIAFGFGAILNLVIGVDIDQALLALAPGGLSEMGLIALAIHADVAYVALHHVVRILMILVAVPLLLPLLERSGRSPDKDSG